MSLITVHFIHPDERVESVQTDTGLTVMEVAREAGVSGILAECGGGAICSTCHVHVAQDWYHRLTPPEATEGMLLELAPGHDAYSRLSCQIELDATHDGISVRVPECQSDY
ncbi:2Fe-2S iron-sulfur cluster-binding protein [Aminobacter aminovorans]|uniref:2Fe-2S ferredoxin n=1 Tax=Aminobacter aminovorans TaxID=83263 RepID=A0AAC8YMH3_AMIAI|nr:2Fe-2S iron-sulfur cluster-binding protein [Aminobacter aminovorans]AMS40131.1 2Fe-2S ferredoxin [Aminobacter aminovorans]MBB3710138.1 2Fe-2S ferredoxin [Aminobacter aminovorans]